MTTTDTPDSSGWQFVQAHHDLYRQLIARFAVHHTDVRGGVEITYINGEQAVSRLNETLGPFGWNFEVLDNGLNLQADEIYVRGRLSIREPDTGEWVHRDQYGSQKIHRSRPLCGYINVETGEVCGEKQYDHDKRNKDHRFIAGPPGDPLDIGFDYKGATTDAMKKCASWFGIGLYLSSKEPQQAGARGKAATTTTQPKPQPTPVRSTPAKVDWTPPSGDLKCESCGDALEARHAFSDGTVWTAQDLAKLSHDNFGKVLCLPEYKTSMQRRKEQQAQPQQRSA